VIRRLSGGGRILSEERTGLDGGWTRHTAEHPLPSSAPVYLDLPLNDLSFRFVELPLDDLEKVRRVLPFELEHSFLDPMDALVMDAAKLPATAGKTHGYLVLAGREEVVRNEIERLGAMGLDPDLVGTSDVAGFFARDVSAGRMVLRTLLEEKPPGDEDRIACIMRAVEDGGPTLRRGNLAVTERLRRTRGLQRRTLALLCATILFLAGAWAVEFAAARRLQGELRDEIRAEYRAMSPGEGAVTDELYQGKLALRALEQRREALQGVPALSILQALGRAKPNDGTAFFREVSVTPDTVQLKGEAASHGSVENVTGKLAAEGFGAVRVVESTSLPDRRVAFVIQTSGLHGAER